MQFITPCKGMIIDLTLENILQEWHNDIKDHIDCGMHLHLGNWFMNTVNNHKIIGNTDLSLEKDDLKSFQIICLMYGGLLKPDYMKKE